MIRGNRKQLELEIKQFIMTDSDRLKYSGKSLYKIEETEVPAEAGNLRETPQPQILYTGCGRMSRPFYILGLCNTSEDFGNLIITHNFKPASFMTGLSRMADNLLPQTSESYRQQIVSVFAQKLKGLIETCIQEWGGQDGIEPRLLALLDPYLNE